MFLTSFFFAFCSLLFARLASLLFMLFIHFASYVFRFSAFCFFASKLVCFSTISFQFRVLPFTFLDFPCCIPPVFPSAFLLASCFPSAFWLFSFFHAQFVLHVPLQALCFSVSFHLFYSLFLAFLFTLIKLDMIAPPSQFEISAFYLSIAFHFFQLSLL